MSSASFLNPKASSSTRKISFKSFMVVFLISNIILSFLIMRIPHSENAMREYKYKVLSRRHVKKVKGDFSDY